MIIRVTYIRVTQGVGALAFRLILLFGLGPSRVLLSESDAESVLQTCFGLTLTLTSTILSGESWS